MKKLSFLLLIFLSYTSFSQEITPEILTGRLVRISPKLIDIKYDELIDTKKKSIKSPKYQELRDKINKRVKFPVENSNATSSDAALQKTVKTINQGFSTSALTASFNGNGSAENTAVGFGLLSPPDPVLCVGPNHVVQMINLVHTVYNKSGAILSGPLKFSSIASTATDDGDPITLYDHIADRYILMQFSSLFTSGSESMIFCVSQTNDPTGAYFVYEFPTPGKFPDYPHVGIWNNSYVVTTHNFNVQGTAYLGQGFWAFDRNKMVNGEPTVTGVAFNATGATDGGYLPASFEGFKTPDPTALPTFITFDADEFGGADRLLIRTLTPNFANPASSVLSAATSLPVAAFDGRSPNTSPIEQQGTSAALDAIADRMMSRIIYRRFDDYESLVMNYAVNVSGVAPITASTYQAATRWYELTRPTSASAWTINQQSTFSPTAISGATGINRWMGCAGIDQRGNMALAYSRSSTTNFPDIYYAERKKTDPVGVLGAEQVFHASGGSQTSSGGRWGDYSAMTTDPSDEETQWFTAEYYATTASVGFKTRIGSFKVSDPLTTPSVHFQRGGTIARQKESVTLLPPNIYYKDYPISLVIDQAPSQPVNLTITKTGTATEGVDYDLLNVSSIVLNGANLTQSFTLRVYDNAFNEADEFIDVAYILNNNAGNAIAGAYNQKHRITIIGTSACPTVNVAVTRPTTFCEGDSTVFNANAIAGYTFQWYRNNVVIPNADQAQLIVKQGGVYYVAITNLGCTLGSTNIAVFVNVGTPVPTTVSRSITFGTVITAGNGLQASAVCPSSQTTTYTGPTVGYDGGTKSGADPQLTISGVGTMLGRTKVAITWRKRSGGTINDCGTTGGAGQPYYNEVSFKIQAPDGTIINLLNAGAYAIGAVPLGLLTTAFEDGGSATGNLPATGTFAPIQALGTLNGTNPNGVWKLIANDDANIDPLCVESFSVTVLTPGTGGASSITWYSSATGGASVGSGTEYIPTNTATGVYTYFAEASCSGLSMCATSVRKPATLTITAAGCLSIGGNVTADATVCSGINNGILTLSGYSGSIIRWESSTDNFVNTNVISNTTTTLNYTNLTQTTKFRAVVKDGICASANSSNATITVTTINAMASNTGPYLTGQTIQLNASGGSSYSWTGPNGFTSISNPANISGATLAMAGVYTVTVSQSGCTATATTLVVITENTACLSVVEYDYVKAGNPFTYKFPLVNNMVIAEVPDQTSILVNPICATVSIESFRMRITGLPYLHEVIESVAPFALFNNTGLDVLGRNLSPGNYALTITGYNQDNALGTINYGPVVTNFTVVSNSASISAPTFVINSLCAGSTFNVNFTTTGAFNPANQFDVQLSDANGTFDNPTIIGSSPSAGVAACTIPINIGVGSSYKIRVVSTNQILTGNTNGSNLVATPAALILVSPTNDISGGTSTKQASQTITATNKVLSPANTIYKAGNAILLNAGFQANASSVFKAEIGGCN